MKIVVAPDSYKGSLTSFQVIHQIAKAAEQVFPGCQLVKIPMADGGEGTVDAFVQAAGGEIRYLTVRGPLQEKVRSKYGIIQGNTAVVEMAAASGLPLVPEDQRDPLKTTSYGTGQIINEVLEEGFRKIIVALGGSATNDCGMGVMDALGVRFLDNQGKVLKPVGANLIHVRDFSVQDMNPLLKEAEITVMCDVNNPLLGANGATYVYGPQKGGTGEILKKLEAGMKNFADVIEKKLRVSVRNIPGSGAAGGISAALVAFASAKLESGISVVLETIGFEQILEGADLVVTGEGRLDAQSARGKVLCGIGTLCSRQGVPAVAVVGGISEGAEMIYEHGISSVMAIPDRAMGLEQALDEAEQLLENAAVRMFRMIKIGMLVKH